MKFSFNHSPETLTMCGSDFETRLIGILFMNRYLMQPCSPGRLRLGEWPMYERWSRLRVLNVEAAWPRTGGWSSNKRTAWVLYLWTWTWCQCPMNTGKTDLSVTSAPEIRIVNLSLPSLTVTMISSRGTWRVLANPGLWNKTHVRTNVLNWNLISLDRPATGNLDSSTDDWPKNPAIVLLKLSSVCSQCLPVVPWPRVGYGI